MSVSVSSFKLVIQGFDPAPTPFTQGVLASTTLELSSIPDGNADNQINRVICTETTISASGTLTVDLRQVDRYGVAHAATDCALLYIRNDGPGTLEVEPGASNGWTNLLATGSALKIPPSVGVLVHAFGAGDLVVGAANKELDITETGGADDADVYITAWTRV